MEELGEGLKERKGMATPYEEKYQLTGLLKDPMDTAIYMGSCMAPTTYVSEECLIWHQREGRHLVLWRLFVPVKKDARGVRPEWVGGCRITL